MVEKSKKNIMIVFMAAFFFAVFSLTSAGATNLTLSSSILSTAPYLVGDILEIEINITNNGSTNYTNYTLYNFFSYPELNYSNSSYQKTPTINFVGNYVLWNQTINVTSNSSLIIYINFSTLVAGELTNNARLENASKDILYNDPFNYNTSNRTIEIYLMKFLNMTNPHYINDTLQFYINVSNNGTDTATNYTLYDNYNPSEINYTSASTTPNFINTTAGIIAWNFNLSAGNSFPIILYFKALLNGTNLSNNAYVQNDSNQTEDNTTIFFNVSTSQALSYSNISIIKSLQSLGPYYINDTITFEINITNSGTANATNFTLIDYFNASLLAFLNSNPTEGSNGSNNVTWHINVTANTTISHYINFTALTNWTNVTNNATVLNSTDDKVASTIITFNISPNQNPSDFQIRKKSHWKHSLRKSNSHIHNPNQ